jgi:2-oxoglutarate ferredoxin oxidoreductase subunit gamma
VIVADDKSTAQANGSAAAGRGAAGAKKLGRLEVRLSGSGGQGIILAASILTDAAAQAGWEVVNTQSYGPEARGGASKAEVVISDEEVDYPEATEPDITLCLSQAAFDRYAPETRAGGLVVYDSGLVTPAGIDDVRLIGAPFTQVAKEQLGKVVVTNIVSLGALTEHLEPISHQAVEVAVARRVPSKFKDLNMKALAAGRELGRPAEAPA